MVSKMGVAKKRKGRRNDASFYEKKPRKPATFSYEDETNTKPLLPIKDSRGAIIKQYGRKQAKENKDQDEEEEKKKVKKEKGYYTADAIAARAQMSLDQRKIQIAHLSNIILTDPQSNFIHLKTLCLMAEETEPVNTCIVVRKLAIASLRCIFIDIIPGYKLRELSEEEKKVKLSKEVRKRTDYEEGLLRYYQKYLEILERAIKSRKTIGKNQKPQSNGQLSISDIAIKSLCDLYAEASNFNFHNNIIMVLVPLMDDNDLSASKMACDAVATLFQSDMGGERSLATIKSICGLVKSKAMSKKPIKQAVLDTFLQLSIHQVDFEAMANYKTKRSREEIKRAAEKKKKMSKKQLKYLKKQEELQKELKETEATVDRNDKIKINTEIVQEIFLTYFRILKKKNGHTTRSTLMPSVLEGLSKFAHCININFFSDLLNVLQAIVRDGEGTHRQNLCCISTAFQVLSGQGEALNIDPIEFYKYLYQALMYLPNLCHSELALKMRRERLQLPKLVTKGSLHITQDCLTIMLKTRKKQVTLSRLLAFAKRISTVAMQMHPPSNALTLLHQVAELLKMNSGTYSLFDSESQSKGIYHAEVDDPDHCFATSACLWEAHTLRRHYCPKVKRKANEILSFGKKSLTL